MVHDDNNTFEVAITALFPQGYGASKKPFETFEMDAYAGQAKFLLDEKREKVIGFGFSVLMTQVCVAPWAMQRELRKAVLLGLRRSDGFQYFLYVDCSRLCS